MKYVELSENLEVMAIYLYEIPNGLRVPNDLPVTCHYEDDFLTQTGTILTQEEVDYYNELFDEKDRLKEKIKIEIQPLIGMSVLNLTDAQRWKMFGVVLFKLGIISSNGIIKPFDDWIDL